MSSLSKKASNPEPISINLNGNRLKLGKDGRWQLDSSELELATLEIERLVSEKEDLAKALEKCLEQVDLLSQEIQDINQAKSVMLEMVN
jgi:exosome complex RNA-binding protein Rrp4